jgi:hypothetical protein
MASDRKKETQPGGPVAEKIVGPQALGDDCRCKETALMTPRQLLRRMMDDLSFWKRAKKG